MKKLNHLHEQISGYGKENLAEILYSVSSEIRDICSCKMVRFFLEDLTEGLLVCRFVSGEHYAEIRGTSHFIFQEDSIISAAFLEKNSVYSSLKKGSNSKPKEFEKKYGVGASLAIPVLEQGKSIGVICLDWKEPDQNLSGDDIDVIKKFLMEIAPGILQAHRFHQRIAISRQIDASRKREAAHMMLKSAVKLIDKLTLASVLVPKYIFTVASSKKAESQDTMEILATFARDITDKDTYERNLQVSVLKDESLISQVVEYDTEKGIIKKGKHPKPLYIPDVMKQKFARKSIAEKLGLCSLYMVPRFDSNTNQVVCINNYFTEKEYSFSPFEKEQLENHAMMVEQLIQETSKEHIEINVLNEIRELRSAKQTDFKSFLRKILFKATELIGADTGTISLVQKIGDRKWLAVDGEGREIIGVKSREWEKQYIPRLKVGGEELTRKERSLTGYSAFLRKPILSNNVEAEIQNRGFYQKVSDSVKSELAVPIQYGDDILGVINLDSFEEDYFIMEHQRILEIISELVGKDIYGYLHIGELQQEIDRLKKDITYRDPSVHSYTLGNVIGKSRAIRSVIREIDIIAESICNRMLRWEGGSESEDLPGLPSILITGETGSGKEFFFNNIYSRLNELFQLANLKKTKLRVKKTNIAAFSGELTYSELFGHKKGAYTGADTDRIGILEEANRGVVFLDEIGDADHRAQVQLLRFLDSGVFTRLGDNHSRHSKLLLVTATNKDLQKEIRAGRFREDLFHRIREFTIDIPSLNERREDIVDLATHFLGKLYSTYKKHGEKGPVPFPDKEAAAYLTQYNYRGNVRELKNILLRTLLSRSGPAIRKIDVVRASKETEKGKISKIDVNDLNESAALKILHQVTDEELDFWEAVYKPYSENMITRQMVKSVMTLAGEKFGRGLPEIAVQLKVCNKNFKENQSERKKFISFKNFLYKTIKIKALP
ncbi:MAG TPA: sigma 54-interacting transcriptional regulator [Nitrospinota bacterium]|nr:sigma 54-interacting transcriptional regulator [Nitrospinota bacterium]